MFLVKTISLFSNIRKPTRQPMLWAALAYASGIVCGVYEWRPESWWVVAAIAFVLAAIYFARRRWWLGFPLALGGLVFVVAITHGHSDHIGGIHAVLNNFRPHELWVGALPDTPAIHELLEYAGDLGVR